MRFHHLALTAVALPLAATAWSACSSGSSAGPVTQIGDAGREAEAAIDASDDDGDTCNPCIQVCPCTPGETFYSPGNCTTYTCAASGSWGGNGCLGPGCVDAEAEASVDGAGPAGKDAAVEASSPDGATDAASDVTTDASSD